MKIVNSLIDELASSFCMYSDSANAYVREAVDAFIARAPQELTRLELDAKVRELIDAIGNVFPEVHDTEPRICIVRAVNDRVCSPQKWQPLSSWDF